MTMYGANPEQLATLGRTLTQPDRGHQPADRRPSTACSNGTDLVRARPATASSQDWNGSFKQALNRLNEAFGAAGHDCVSRARPSSMRVMGG